MVPASAIVVSIDPSELLEDAERIKSGELELPTVSAVKIVCGEYVEELPVWLDEA